jgi:hypothetical protein
MQLHVIYTRKVAGITNPNFLGYFLEYTEF